MKNKNGFTLIELLAILIILGIIALITVPIITNTLNDARINTAIDSAYGYVRAVDKLNYSKSLNDDDILEDGMYTVSELKALGVSVNGREPSDGWVELEESEVVAFSIKMGDYVITKYRDSEIVCENGDVQPDEATKQQMELQAEISEKVDSYVKAVLAANSSLESETVLLVSDISGITTNVADSGWIHFNKVNNSVVVVDYSLTYGDLTANYSSLTDGNYVSTFGETRNKPMIITLGSDVCLTETDCFKVIEINGGTATLLANNNINTSTGMQGANGQSYEVAFSGSQYWTSSDININDIYDPSKNDESGTNYSVAYYVNQYVENLQDLGFNVTSGRILKKYEVESGGKAESYKESGEYYWLGSAVFDRPNVWFYALGGGIGLDPYSNSSIYGVRPVIVISTSDIK